MLEILFFAFAAASAASGGGSSETAIVSPSAGAVAPVAPAAAAPAPTVPTPQAPAATAQAAPAISDPVAGQGVVIGAAPSVIVGGQVAGLPQFPAPAATPAPAAAPAAPAAPAAAAPQEVPTGKFTTAQEVKPILTATRGNWVALRRFNGEDLLYFTHLEAWRCGLKEIRFSINSAAARRVWEVEPCYLDTAQPNAIKMEGRVPYIALPPDVVTSVTVAVVYDDGTEDQVTFGRNEIMMP